MNKWRKLTSKNLLKHGRIEVWEDEVVLLNGTRTTYVHFGKSQDAVTIIPVHTNGTILVQKEYSYPPNEWLLQFPGGGTHQDEVVKQAALRELSEEADLTGDLTKIGWYYINNRRSSAKMHVYIARNLQAAPGKKDAEEEFENYWLSESEIDEKIKSCEVKNYSMLAAWSFYKNN